MPASVMDDLLIQGGHLIDGSGGPGRDADVAVRAGRTAGVEPRSARPAHRVIDARGQIVAPHPHALGFHASPQPARRVEDPPGRDARGRRQLRLLGRAGAARQAAILRDYLASSATWLPFQDTTFADYAAAFPSTPVNVILQIGHNTLRLMTAGLDTRPLTPDEMAPMERMLEEALAGGAWGLSSGLFTEPGNFADATGIPALARVPRRHGAAYSTLVRDEADLGLLQQLDDRAMADRRPRRTNIR
jgi:N-acyl-D-amino-acid deacylase